MRAALAAALLLLALPAAASAAPQPVSIGTFATPVHVAAPPGDASRVFVVEKAGRVQVLVNGVKAATPFLDVTADVRDTGEEEGLLSIAFAPDYATSGLFYVFYTDNGGDLAIAEGLRSADPNRGAIQRVVFTVQHDQADNHNGGQLAFGPDGLLYVGTGDGGTQGDPEGDAQNPNSQLGKILRIDPRTSTVPAMWALGLRNPWRFSFDRGTGTMVIGDVGGGANEEIDVAPATGGNFGWPACEGSSGTCPGAIAPALSLSHNDGYTGVIGGFVVRDPGLPTLLGRYVFGDLSKDRVFSAALGTDTVPRREESLPITGPTSFGEDACGRIYVAAFDGPVYRIQDGSPSACPSGPSPPGTNPTPTGTTHGCGLKVSGQKRTQKILRRGKALRLRLRSAEPCTVIVRGKRFRGKTVVLSANVTRTVRLKATKRGLRKLRRTLARSDKPRLRVSVTISARDTAGNFGVQRLKPRVR
jgi:Glucose / Sorbosone dehydrogenase